jgi:hypothetical protein
LLLLAINSVELRFHLEFVPLACTVPRTCAIRKAIPLLDLSPTITNDVEPSCFTSKAKPNPLNQCRTPLTKHQVGLEVNNGGNHDYRELRRKNHQPEGLNTLFKHAGAPHSLRDTPDNSSSGTNDTVEPDASVQGSIWPLDGLHARSYLTSEDAVILIGQGALHFEGSNFQAYHTSQPRTRYFAFAGVIGKDGHPSLSSRSGRLSPGFSLVLGGRVDKDQPWDTLEQPSMTMCFGKIPGSISLNRYVGRVNRPLKDKESNSLIERREMSMRDILDRLACLQHGLDLDVSYSLI